MQLGEVLCKTIRFESPKRTLGWLWWDGEGRRYHSHDDLTRTEAALPHAWKGHQFTLPMYEAINSKASLDAWGCVWQVELPGLCGQVVSSPISDYDDLQGYKVPVHLLDDVSVQATAIREDIKRNPDIMHKVGWMQLYERMRYLRPAQELYIDIAERHPCVFRLRDAVMEYLNRELDIYLKLGVDVVTFSEDWGTQTSLQISPSSWREIFMPAYKVLFDRIHKAGCMVEFHSCGHILGILDGLVELGVEVVHSQVSCMDLAELARRYRGRICFEADFDRQQMPRQTPEWVKGEVHRIADELGADEGGLFIVAEVAGATPLANVEAYIEAIGELSSNDFIQASGDMSFSRGGLPCRHHMK